jgi:hypothetical protein
MSAGVLAILVGGGPAPGINAVISAAVIEAVNEGFEVVGIADGFKWLIRGDISKVRSLGINDVSRIHLEGSSMLGTARDNPTTSEQAIRTIDQASVISGTARGQEGEGCRPRGAECTSNRGEDAKASVDCKDEAMKRGRLQSRCRAFLNASVPSTAQIVGKIIPRIQDYQDPTGKGGMLHG